MVMFILSIKAAMLMTVLEYFLQLLKCNVQNEHIHSVHGACAADLASFDLYLLILTACLVCT